MKRSPGIAPVADQRDQKQFSVMPTLTLLHTCDLHGRLSEAKAEAIRKLREALPDCLLLDCGDALHGGNLSPGWGAEPVKERMNRAGYTAMAMGNRETHLWWGAVRRKLQGFDFPVLSSNLIGARPPVERSLVLNVGRIRIGLFALTPPMVLPGTFSARFSTVQFSPPLEAAGIVVQELRAKVDLLIALSHLGRAFDRRLPEAVPGIDLILGGHDHLPGLPAGEWVGSTFMARSSPFGDDIGAVTIVLDRETAGAAMEARLLPLAVT